MERFKFLQRLYNFIGRFKLQLTFLLLVGISLSSYGFLHHLLQSTEESRTHTQNNQPTMALNKIEEAVVIITESGRLIKSQLEVLKTVLQAYITQKE